jgi:outer membrane lipoprotein carrier protein
MYKFIFLYLSLALTSALPGFGQSDGYTTVGSEKTVAGHLQDFSEKLITIQCDFHQVKKMQFLDIDLESSGKFWFLSPDKVRWEYRSPYKYIVLLNEGKLNLISESNQNEIDMRSNAVFEEVNALIVSAVSGNIFDNSGYSVKSFENDLYYKIELKPVSGEVAMIIEQMELYFNKKNYAVSQIKIIEPSADYSLIRFTNQVFNEPLTENIFRP